MIIRATKIDRYNYKEEQEIDNRRKGTDRQKERDRAKDSERDSSILKVKR